MVRYLNPTLMIRDRQFSWGDRTYIMGVLNVTPDSFSDGGEFISLQNALNHAQHLEISGADILDIGGQSTRPGAEEVSPEEEIKRVIPLIDALRSRSNCPISVDTYRARVAAAALDAGADIINDVSGGTADPEMLPLMGKRHVPAILMHMRGTPKTMQSLTQYDDVVAEVAEKLQQHIQAAIACGVSPNQLILDPGIGFAKTQNQNLRLLRELPQLHPLGYPLLLGVSRKSFIGRILDRPDAKDRLWGTAAACTAAIAAGADILRVHDLPAMSDVARVADVLFRG